MKIYALFLGFYFSYQFFLLRRCAVFFLISLSGDQLFQRRCTFFYSKNERRSTLYAHLHFLCSKSKNLHNLKLTFLFVRNVGQRICEFIQYYNRKKVNSLI